MFWHNYTYRHVKFLPSCNESHFSVLPTQPPNFSAGSLKFHLILKNKHHFSPPSAVCTFYSVCRVCWQNHASCKKTHNPWSKSCSTPRNSKFSFSGIISIISCQTLPLCIDIRRGGGSLSWRSVWSQRAGTDQECKPAHAPALNRPSVDLLRVI